MKRKNKILEFPSAVKTEQNDYLQFKSVLIPHYLIMKKVNFMELF